MKTKTLLTFPLLVLPLLLLRPGTARAHCDTVDGPVVATARTALETGQLAPVLAWVKVGSEREIQVAFQKAIDARKKNPGARDASDRRFFETLVRVHRAGEGAAYGGLKAAGEGVTEAVRTADTGIARGDGAAVEALLGEAVRDGLRRRFAALNALRPPAADVAEGRRWVEAYVDYVHYVEALETAAAGSASHHEGGGEHTAHGASAREKAEAHGHAH